MPLNETTTPSWDEIVARRDRIYRLAYRLTGNHYDAEDLTQDTLVRVLRTIDSYRPGTFDGWVHRITTNLFLDMARRRSRLRIDPALPGIDVPAAWQDQPERGFEHGTFDIDIQQALDQLSADHRAVLVLVDIEGYSYDEAANMLGVRLGTVQSRLHRARARLRELLPHRAPGVDAVALGAV